MYVCVCVCVCVRAYKDLLVRYGEQSTQLIRPDSLYSYHTCGIKGTKLPLWGTQRH